MVTGSGSQATTRNGRKKPMRRSGWKAGCESLLLILSPTKAASSGDDDWGEDFWEEETKEDEWDHWQDADEMQTSGSLLAIAETVKAASQYPVQRLHVSPQDRGGQRSQGKGKVGQQVDLLSYLSRSLKTCCW